MCRSPRRISIRLLLLRLLFFLLLFSLARALSLSLLILLFHPLSTHFLPINLSDFSGGATLLFFASSEETKVHPHRFSFHCLKWWKTESDRWLLCVRSWNVWSKHRLFKMKLAQRSSMLFGIGQENSDEKRTTDIFNECSINFYTTSIVIDRCLSCQRESERNEK